MFGICVSGTNSIFGDCCPTCYAQTVGKGEKALLLSVRPSVCPSVCPSVTYIAHNSRNRRPSVPKFGRKVPHLRCHSHTSFKVERSKVRVGGWRGHTVSAEPGGHTAYFSCLHDFKKSFIEVNLNVLIYHVSNIPSSSSASS